MCLSKLSPNTGMLSHFKILGTMRRTIRKFYSSSSRYIFCLSEGLLLWVLTLFGHIFGKLYGPRKPTKSKNTQSHYQMRDKIYIKDQEEDEELNSKDDDTAFSIRKCAYWFESNVKNSQNLDEMNEEDVIRFVHEINKDLEDVVLLVLAYKMNAARVGIFTLAEWLKGMRDLEIDSSAKLIAKWEWLRSLLDDKTFLRSVYRFSFKFSRSPNVRNLEMYLCQGLIRIFFQDRWALVDNFIEFLSSTKYSIMTYDEFCSVYEFQEHIKDDLSNYDFDGAWPILLDDFVVYMKQKTSAEDGTSQAIGQ